LSLSFFLIIVFSLLSFFFTLFIVCFFFSNDTATTEIYSLSLHDALPIFLCFLLCYSFASFSQRLNKEDVMSKLNLANVYWQENKDRKSTRLNSSHVKISYAVFCLKKKKKYN